MKLTVSRLGAALTIAAVAAASVLVSPLAAEAAVPVDFTGSGGLKACINKALGKPVTDPVTKTQLVTLQELSCTDANIGTLAPLEWATNLHAVDLAGNAITNLDPLADHSELISLYVKNNPLIDVSALSTMKNLIILSLGTTQLDSSLDVSAIGGLTKLTSLGLYGRAITDIAVMSNLTNLDHIELGETSLSDLTALSSLSEVTSLAVYDSYVTDVSPLASLHNLTQLNLENNQITDVSPLSSLSALVVLLITGNQVTTLPPLGSMTALKYLHFDDNQVADLSPVAARPELIHIYAGHNRISDLTPLAGSTGLQILLLADNSVRDLTPLAGLPGLAQLDVVGQQLSLPTVATSQQSPAPTVKTVDGVSVNLSIADGIGFFENGVAVWSVTGSTALEWSQTTPFGTGKTTVFSGTVAQNVESPIVAGTAGIEGVASVGSVLTATTSGWASNLALTYSWLRDGVPTGATGPTYLLGEADGTHVISVRVTGSRSSLLFVSAESAPTAPIVPLPAATATGTQGGSSSTTPITPTTTTTTALAVFAKHPAPRITGMLKVGKKLTAKAGIWDKGVTLRYRWLANGHAIKKATKATLKLTKSLRSKKITLVVTATKVGYAMATLRSTATKKVK